MARVSGLPSGAARERTADVLRHVGLYEERYRRSVATRPA
jgi:ABC-2 type transport system ATP-binding protein